jgi:hypothetical protein
MSWVRSYTMYFDAVHRSDLKPSWLLRFSELHFTIPGALPTLVRADYFCNLVWRAIVETIDDTLGCHFTARSFA